MIIIHDNNVREKAKLCTEQPVNSQNGNHTNPCFIGHSGVTVQGCTWKALAKNTTLQLFPIKRLNVQQSC